LVPPEENIEKRREEKVLKFGPGVCFAVLEYFSSFFLRCSVIASKKCLTGFKKGGIQIWNFEYS